MGLRKRRAVATSVHRAEKAARIRSLATPMLIVRADRRAEEPMGVSSERSPRTCAGLSRAKTAAPRHNAARLNRSAANATARPNAPERPVAATLPMGAVASAGAYARTAKAVALPICNVRRGPTARLAKVSASAYQQAPTSVCPWHAPPEEWHLPCAGPCRRNVGRVRRARQSAVAGLAASIPCAELYAVQNVLRVVFARGMGSVSSARHRHPYACLTARAARGHLRHRPGRQRSPLVQWREHSL